jgi:hypothetical protein
MSYSAHTERRPATTCYRKTQDELPSLRTTTVVTASTSVMHTWLRLGCVVPLLGIGNACAEGTQEGTLDESTLVGGGTGGDAAAAGVGGSTPGPSGGTGTGGGGKPPVAGSSSMSGSGGAGAGGAPSGGSSGAGVAGGSGGAGGMAGAAGKAGSGGKGGAGGAGGTGGTGGTGVTGGTGHRFAKLVATSEQGGKVWSSVAELQLFTTGDVALARGNWDVSADSEELDDEEAPAAAAIDGDTATFWHSAWEPGGTGDAALPHELVVDMGASHTLTGFSYLPRQDQPNGRIAAWQFFVSKDGTSWGTAVKTGTFTAGASVQKVVF